MNIKREVILVPCLGFDPGVVEARQSFQGRRVLGLIRSEMSGLEDSRLNERPESRTLGYQVVAWMLQPLAAEYLLKSLSIRDAGGFSKTHDLLKLFESLDRRVQDELGEQGAQQGIAIPGFLAERCRDCVEWRYPFEDKEDPGAIPDPVGFDNVLAVLVGVCEPGSPQARRILETENERLGSLPRAPVRHDAG